MFWEAFFWSPNGDFVVDDSAGAAANGLFEVCETVPKNPAPVLPSPSFLGAKNEEKGDAVDAKVLEAVLLEPVEAGANGLWTVEFACRELVVPKGFDFEAMKSRSS